MRQFTQQNRRLKFTCDTAGDDVLQLVSFSGVEEMSRPFRFTLELVSTSADVRPAAIVGHRASFCVVMPDEADTERWFDGFISRFTYRGTDDRASTSRYQAEIVPWIWFMGRTSDCRIFQNLSIPEIVREVLGDCPHFSFDDSGVDSGAHQKLEYCVQYRETDLEFVSRLLERAGIFYYFTHKLGEHKLILADTKSGYVECVESKVSLHSTHSEAPDQDMLIAWERRAEFNSGAVAGTDYNYKTPSVNLATAAATTMSIEGIKSFELFEYPGGYPDTGQGDAVVNVRMQEQEAMHDVVSGRSRCCTFHAGGRFTVEKHYNPAEEGSAWALLSVLHEADLGGSYTAESGSRNSNGNSSDMAAAHYTNEFVCIPAETTFRPARRTPRPVIGGHQTAVVVGESGQEIQVDNLGRIRLQFFWDRRGHKKADVSRWVRVAQAWAGPGYGTWFLPRVGNEVVVAFEEGDPDRPLVVGSVYHAENKQPFSQPGNKTQSGIKTRSSQGGGAGNCNEIKFEDKKGGELLFFQAEKDQTIVVKNNRSESVGNNRTESVGHDEKITIGNDRTDSVGGNETRSVAKDRTRTVTKNETVTVSLTRTHTVGINEAITVGAAQEVTVGAAQTISVGAVQSTTVGASQTNVIGAGQTNTIGSSRSVSVGSDQSTKIGGGHTIAVGKDRSATIGANDALSVSKKLTINAGDEITIKTGDASIHMKKDGTITMKGKDITIQGSGKITVHADKNTVVEGQKILLN